MQQAVAAFGSGVTFAAGLALAGMTQPSKVVGFLDFFGDWDPSLAFVMGGAIAVHLVLYRVVTRRSSPLLDEIFHVPTRRDFSLQLVLGSAIFGVGWGLGGFCPGPGLASLPTLGSDALLFVAAMSAGIYLHDGWSSWMAQRRSSVDEGSIDVPTTATTDDPIGTT
jgi:hypothetical protein